MDVFEELKLKGWHMSKEGFEHCIKDLEKVTVSSVIQKALDIDLRDVGGSFLPEDANRGKLEFISGPGVVQIQKVKNASAPKYEYGSGAPAIFRLLLTDGSSYVNCLQWGPWKSITMDTPPGTKIYLKPGKIPMQNNFLLLKENQFVLLGGCVAAMVEKWELCRRLASHVRTNENTDGSGPPPWIPFGKPIISDNPVKMSSNFRSLEPETKGTKEEDAVFKQQRMANIAEVSRVKDAKTKTFGGGKDKPASSKPESETYLNSPFNNSGYNRTSKSHEDQGYESKSSYRAQKQYDGKASKYNRGDGSWATQDSHKFRGQNDGVCHGQFYVKDKKLDQRNRFNTDTAQNMKNYADYQPRLPSNVAQENTNVAGSAKRLARNSHVNNFKVLNNTCVNTENKGNILDNVTYGTSQVKLHGYENEYIHGETFLKPGVKVMAKYWEDSKFYPAVIHAVGKEGTTCVVHFLEYGNYEEVLVDDVQQISSEWNVGSFQSGQLSNSENQAVPQNTDFRDNSKHNSSASYTNNYNRQERQKSRQDHRPSAKLYQPPHQRQMP